MHQLGPQEGIVNQVEVAVQIGPAHQGQQLGGGPIQQGAVGVAAQHHLQPQPPCGPGHQQRLRQTATLEQFDVDPIHIGGQAHHIRQVPAAFIGHQGDRAIQLQGGELGRIGLRIQQGRQGLFNQNHPSLRQPAHHGAGRFQTPAAVGIHLQFGRGAAQPLLACLDGGGHRQHQGPVMLHPLGAAQLELDAACRQLLPPALQPLQHRRHRTQPQGDAGGHGTLAIQSPQTGHRQA